MDADTRWTEASCYDGLFDPQDDVIARAPLVIAEIVVKADFQHRIGFQETDCLIGPAHLMPAIRCLPFIIEVYLHWDLTFSLVH